MIPFHLVDVRPMTRNQKELANSMKFQISLLRLAVVPHGTPQSEAGIKEARELAKLSERAAPRKPRRVGASQ